MAAATMLGRAKRKTPAKATQGTVGFQIRVLRLLEYFSHVRDYVTVMEVSRALDIPQSSTSTLLSRLVESGYVGHDRWRRLYYPTARAALIGLRLSHRLPYGDNLLDLMEQLSDMSRGAVFLTTVNCNFVQTVHVVEPEGGDAAAKGIGAKYRLVTSTPGRIILASAPETQACGFVRRHNAEARTQDRVNLRWFLDELAQLRERGYALSRQPESLSGLPDVTRTTRPSPTCPILKENRLSIALPASSWLETLALTIGFPNEIDPAEEIDFAETAKSEIRNWMSAQQRPPIHFSMGATH